MYSTLISKLSKAKSYSAEPDRIHFQRFQLTFRGDNADHVVYFDEGYLICDCHYYPREQWCSHTKAIEEMLGEMLYQTDRAASPTAQEKLTQVSDQHKNLDLTSGITHRNYHLPPKAKHKAQFKG